MTSAVTTWQRKVKKKNFFPEKEEKRRRITPINSGTGVSRVCLSRRVQRRALIVVRAPHVTQVHTRLRHGCVPVSAYVRP